MPSDSREIHGRFRFAALKETLHARLLGKKGPRNLLPMPEERLITALIKTLFHLLESLAQQLPLIINRLSRDDNSKDRNWININAPRVCTTNNCARKWHLIQLLHRTHNN